jgi:hypothetical protein
MNPIFTSLVINNLTKTTGNYIPKPPIKGPNKDDKPDYGWIGIALAVLGVVILVCTMIKR